MGANIDHRAREGAVAQAGHGDQELAFIALPGGFFGGSAHARMLALCQWLRKRKSPAPTGRSRRFFWRLGRGSAKMRAMQPYILAIAACAVALACPDARADDYASDWAHTLKAEARLVAGAPGEAGVEVRLAPGAITYWRNPGDAGAPPRFDFAGSHNLASAEADYPAPTRIAESDGSEAFGYRDSVVFPIRVAATDTSKPVELALRFDYAVCEKLCLPARATLKLTLPANDESPYAPELLAARALTPRAIDAVKSGGEFTASGEGTWRFCAPAEPGPERDLFIEAPSGWWVESKAATQSDGRACFALQLQQKPADGALPVDIRATLTGGLGPREFTLTLAPKA
ncbi:MAG: hypothetical protein E7774_11580 [Bradyrhizobium sp.]|nr:MAG: hypothetical protein E7774_11580 [Bradyrhizobium sp.]